MRKLFAAGALSAFTLLSLHHAHAQDTDPTASSYLLKNAIRLGLSPDDVKSSQVSSSHFDAQTGLRYTYLQQYYQGLPVHNQILVTVWKGGQLMHRSGSFIKGVDALAGSPQASLSAGQAVQKAAQLVGLSPTSELQPQQSANGVYQFAPSGLAREAITASLTWVFDSSYMHLKLGWMVAIDAVNSVNYWNIFVDAQTGAEIRRENFTVNEVLQHKPQATKAASFQPFNLPPAVTNGDYYVSPYPLESPKHGPLALENKPWLKAGAGNAATTLGWHNDGVSDYDYTRGNNVFAYLDLSNTNAPSTSNFSANSSTSSPSLTFNYTPDLTLSPATTVNRNFALTNLFYWNNIVHDMTYQYGFTEAAGNFQADNQGRGGAGGDYVRAEAQDGGGTSNANFSSPSDGGSGRMQMYLWPSNSSSVRVNSPAGIAGNYTSVEGAMSSANALTAPVTANLVYVNDASATTHEGCGTIANGAQLAGKIAVIDRGTCNFTVKVKNAQLAGAIGVIVVNNTIGSAITMSGSDNTITIPAVMISQNDGTTLTNQLLAGATISATLMPAVAADGDLDNGVVVHEYGHGVSNRLTGGRLNAGCLSNAEQGGEGWSDYLALMLTTNWSNMTVNSGSNGRAMGTYASSQAPTGSGIRTFPYSTNMSINPLTYSNMSGNGEAHFIGEIWCSALWDMTWNIIQQEGTINNNLFNSNGTGGNSIALKLVLQGMKLQPCSPGFLDARDAILAADSILYNNAHRCSIWNAFARRGMGYSAYQGSSDNTTDQVPAFDVPSSLSLISNSEPVKTSPNGTLIHTIKATCGCSPMTGVNLRDSLPAGFTYLGSTGGSLTGTIVTFSNLSFAANETKTLTVQATQNGNTGCPTDSVLFDNRDGILKGSLTSSGTPAWTNSTVLAHSGSNSWSVADASTPTDISLVSNAIQVYPYTYLSFWQSFNTEMGYDGGRVEISTNGGTSYFDAAPYIIQTGYNQTMEDNPWGAGQRAFSGTTRGGFINTVINLSSFNGQTVRIRFRMQSDSGNPANYDGWFVDDIMVLRGCGNTMSIGAYGPGGQLLSSYQVPVFMNGSGFITATQEPLVAENNLVVSPNPADVNTRLAFANPVTDVRVRVFDAQGKLVYELTRKGQVSNFDIPVSNWAKGFYLIKVQTGSKEYERKLFVAH